MPGLLRGTLGPVRPRGLWLPPGIPILDPTDPINRGRVGCWVTTGEGGAVPVIRDLVTQNILTRTGTGPTIGVGSFGLQASDNNSGNGWTAPLSAAQQPTTAWTCLWFGQLANGANQGMFVGGLNNNTGSNPYYSWGIQRSSSGQIDITTNASGGYAISGFSPFASTNSGIYCLVGSLTMGGTIYVYSNGTFVGSSSAVSGTIAYTGSAVVNVGTQQGLGRSASAGMAIGCVWNRQLTLGESARVSANPSAGLLFPRDLLYAAARSSGPTYIFLSLSSGLGLSGRARPALNAGIAARSAVASQGHTAPSLPLATHASTAAATQGHATVTAPASVTARSTTAAQSHATPTAAANIAARSTTTTTAHQRPATTLNVTARATAATTARAAPISRIAIAARATAAASGRAAIGTTINVIAIAGRLGVAVGGFVRLVLRLPPPPPPTPSRTSMAGSVNRSSAAPFVDRAATSRRVTRSTTAGEP